MIVLRRTKYIHNGQIFSIYLIWYGFIRYFIEMFRTDSLLLGNMKIAQVISVAMILIGLYILIVQSRKPKLDDLYNQREEDITF